ncbi:MAG TPA: glycosyltransferase [bacterium]|nr:glycosyltransferase [bacterium]
MLNLVSVRPKPLDRYAPLLAPALVQEIEELGRRLRGVRLLHLNSTSYGGGVAELLLPLVALERALGVEVEWRTLSGDEAFFGVTKQMHNALQGKPAPFTEEQRATYLTHNRAAAAALDQHDVIIVHDPQPAAIRHYAGRRGARWVWRCHIDTSAPDETAWTFLRPYVEEYDAAVFTMAQFVPPDLQMARVEFIPPAIDPLSSKNRPLPDEVARGAVAEFGVDVERPLILQVARFDPWKDPQGAIAAYQAVKRELPAVQLALVGSMAGDDPEAWEVYRSIEEEDRRDPDLYVFTNLVGVGSLEVNCFQRVAAVALQKSIREGFGLAVSEALWKGVPVVGGATGGIPLQVQDGVGGFLVNTVEQAAQRLTYLLRHPEEAAQIAAAGRRVVAEHFLLPRLLRDELRLLHALLEGAGG